MIHRIRVQSRRTTLYSLVILAVAGATACFPRVEDAPRLSISAEALDRIDAAVDELAEGRWASWTMEVVGSKLAFQVEVAEASPADVCSGIGQAVRTAGEGIAWSADLTRGGQPLTRCGTLDVLAKAPAANTRS